MAHRVLILGLGGRVSCWYEAHRLFEEIAFDPKSGGTHLSASSEHSTSNIVTSDVVTSGMIIGDRVTSDQLLKDKAMSDKRMSDKVMSRSNLIGR